MKHRRMIITLRAQFLTVVFFASLAHAADTTKTKLWPANNLYLPLYYSSSRVLPELDTVTVQRTYILPGVDAEYKYEAFVEGRLFATSIGAPLRFALPEGLAGKDGMLVVSYRTRGHNEFTLAESLWVPIIPAALFARITSTTLRAGEPLHLTMYKGILRRPLPSGAIVHVTDDQEGRFFNTRLELDAGKEGIDFDIPMRTGASAAAPTNIVITIRSDSSNQLYDCEIVRILPRSEQTTLDPSVKALLGVSLNDLAYDKAVVCSLSSNEVGAIEGNGAFLHALRKHKPASPTDTVIVRPTTCIAVWMNGTMKIVRLALTTSVARSSSKVAIDKRTGGTIVRTETMELSTERSDLHGAKLDDLLQTMVTYGLHKGETLDAVLRSTACLK